MSTDSTELTFVRCPACRSLVPAVSTRCRMCGATLDAAAQKVEEPPRDSPKSGRVRQRTTSVSGSDLSAAAGLIRQEMGDAASDTESAEADLFGGAPSAVEASSASEPAAPEAGLFSGAASASPSERDDDPLSAYIQEIDSEEPAANGSSTNGAAGSHSEDSTRSQAAEKASEASVAATRVPEAKPSEPRSSEAQPRVIIETGPRKANKPSNLSFGSGRGREEEPKAASASGEEGGWQQVPSPRETGPRDRATKAPAAPSAGSPREARAENRQEQRRPEQGRTEQNRADQSRSEQSRSDQGRVPQGSQRGDDGRGQQTRGDQRSSERQGSPQGARRPDGREGGQREQRQGDPRQGEQRQQEQRNQEQRPRREAQSEVEFAQAHTGKLVGWLVSYSDPRGSASELREGRFFFTGSPLKPHDVVLDDPSISTPHALVAVGVGEGLRVQDLMSDRGVWVKRQGQAEFQRVTDAVKIEHGDWLRLGEIEFMVCLITAPGAVK